MNELNDHYRILLGLDSNWEVRALALSVEGRQVEILLEFVGHEVHWPECGVRCGRHDTAPERTWRHLVTMQFETVLRAKVPRCNCGRCGVKTIAVPWAGKSSRFTLMFEAFALRVLQTCSNVKKAAALLGLKWEGVHTILERGVARGLERREVETIKHVDLDEKSFQHGQSYVSVMVDLGGSRVLEVTAGRTADELWESLPKTPRKQVRTVAIKENFHWFWKNQCAGNARKYFAEWYAWASRCRLAPIVSAAKLLKRHLPKLITYMRHPITNAMTERLNSTIQNKKSDARGFRSFENYRTRILFYCGKLDVMPPLGCH